MKFPFQGVIWFHNSQWSVLAGLVLGWDMWFILLISLLSAVADSQDGCQEDGLVDTVRKIQDGGVLGSHLVVRVLKNY